MASRRGTDGVVRLLPLLGIIVTLLAAGLVATRMRWAPLPGALVAFITSAVDRTKRGALNYESTLVVDRDCDRPQWRAGGSLEGSLVKLPARRRIGVIAYATFARGNDLGNGLVVYPIWAISAALLTFIA